MSIETTCPSCGHPQSTASAEPLSCAECGQWFVPADADSGEEGRRGPHELEIQNSPGDAIRGPFDRVDLRERLYLGLLTGDELARPVGGRFSTLKSQPDFAAILALKQRGRPRPVMVRRAPPKPAPSAGAGTASAPTADVAEAPTAGAQKVEAAPEALRAAAEAEVKRTDPRRATMLAVGTLIIGGLVLGFAYMAVSLAL